MKHDVYISRGRGPREVPRITFDEWCDYVMGDDEMTMVRVVGGPASDGDTDVTYQILGIAYWNAWPGRGRGDRQAWFDWREGEIVAKRPDKATLAKTKAIAVVLGARVVSERGDEIDVDPSGNDPARRILRLFRRR